MMNNNKVYLIVFKCICIFCCVVGNHAFAQKGPVSGQANVNLGDYQSGAIGTTFIVPVNVDLIDVLAIDVNELDVSAALGNYRIALSYDNTLIKVNLSNGLVEGGITPEFSTPVSANIITNGSNDILVISQSQLSGSTPTGLVNVAQIEFEILNGDGVTAIISPAILDLRTPISFITATQELIGGVEIPYATVNASLAILPPIDTDGDGMPDIWEVLYGFLDLLNSADAILDSDGDGLNNLGEYQNATGPDNPDSDNDLVPDGAEITAGTDPLNETIYPLWIVSTPVETAITNRFYQYAVVANDIAAEFSLFEFPAGMVIDPGGFVSWFPESTQGGSFDVIVRATKGIEIADQRFTISVDYKGDINLDGVVNVADLLLIQQNVLGLKSFTADQVERADMYPTTGDGQITIQDSLLLMRVILGL